MAMQDDADMTVRLRWSRGPCLCLLAGSLSLGACRSEIALGSECASDRSPCLEEPAENRDKGAFDAGKRNPKPDAMAGLDASTDASAGDAEPPPLPIPMEAGVDTGAPPIGLGIDNPSFEGPAGSLYPINSVSLPSWESCGGNVSVVESAYVSSGFPAMQTTLLPSDGNTFLELSLVATGPGAVVQTLPAPLTKGTRYAFAVDLAQSGIGTATLEVRSGRASCAFGAALFKSDNLVSDGAWHTTCLTLTPDADVSELVLVMTTSVAGVSIYVDALRSDPVCP